MEFFAPILIGIIALAIIVAGAYFSSKRKKELQVWASYNGYTFSPARDHTYDIRYPRATCLCRGSSRYAANIMTGTHNSRPFVAFDYHYVTGSGKNRHAHLFSAVLVQGPVPLKPLLIRPENILDKIADFAGFNDIDFESAQFSRQFYVSSADKKWAYDIIHPQMMEYLLNSPVFLTQFDSSVVILWRETRFSASEFQSALDYADGIFTRIPDYVLKSLQA